MEVDDAANDAVTTDLETEGPAELLARVPEQKLLPFASGLLPTGTGRANELCEMNTLKLQKALKPALTDGNGVLGDVSFVSAVNDYVLNISCLTKRSCWVCRRETRVSHLL